MPSMKYSPERKAAALASFDKNQGDVLITHDETGIPLRTLYTWRHEWLEQQPSQDSVISSSSPLPQFENDVDFFRHLRHKILAIALKLVPLPMPENPHKFKHRMRAEIALIDLIIKLNDILRPYDEQERAQAAAPPPISLRSWYENEKVEQR